MRELVYYIATTVDGFIARPDGSFDEFPWDEAFIDAIRENYPETLPAPMRPDATRDENRRFDAVVMGRHTYEVGVKQGLTNPYPTLDQYVFSTSLTESPDPAVTVVDRAPVDFVRDLKKDEARAIWICGGSTLATPLYEAGLVDRLIVKTAPVVFGSGIPLFRARVDVPSLRLESRRTFESGYVISEYVVD